jgi:hypothetical protein
MTNSTIPLPPAPERPLPPTGLDPSDLTPAPTNGMAIASLVFGVLGGVLLAVVFGLVALSQIRRRGGRGRGMAIAGLVLSACWTVVIALVVVAALTAAPNRDEAGAVTDPGQAHVQSLQVGDCIDGLADQTVVSAITFRPCAEPHQAEVFAQFELPTGPWPGPEAVVQLAEDGCGQRVPDLTGHPQLATLGMFTLTPVENAWAMDQTVTCLVLDTTGLTLTGSVLA